MSATSPDLTKQSDEDAASDAMAASAAGERGSIVIADRVVEKVAGKAAGEVDRAAGTPRRVLGQTLGKVRPDSAVRASAKVDGSLVSVSLSISVEYPSPVRDVAAEVRQSVMDRVQELCGLEVVEVQVDVPHFYTAQMAQPTTRRVQ